MKFNKKISKKAQAALSQQKRLEEEGEALSSLAKFIRKEKRSLHGRIKKETGSKFEKFREKIFSFKR